MPEKQLLILKNEKNSVICSKSKSIFITNWFNIYISLDFSSLLITFNKVCSNWLAFHSFKVYYFSISSFFNFSSTYYLDSYFLLFFNFFIPSFLSDIYCCFSAFFSYSIVTGPLFIDPTYIKCWNFPVWIFFSSYFFFNISTNF